MAIAIASASCYAVGYVISLRIFVRRTLRILGRARFNSASRAIECFIYFKLWFRSSLTESNGSAMLADTHYRFAKDSGTMGGAIAPALVRR